MPALNLNFQGINRAVSDFGNAGACEELINLRPTGTGLVPVVPITGVDVTVDKVFTHKVGDDTNYIGLLYASSGNILFVYKLNSVGTPEALIRPITVPSYATHFSVDHVHYAAAGNIILLSIADKEDGYYRNVSFRWNGSSYEEMEADAPDITMSATGSTPILKSTATAFTYTPSSSQSEIETQLLNGMESIQQSNESMCFGPVLIAAAFKTTDGQTFWTGKWMMYNPVPAIDADGYSGASNFHIGSSSETLGWFPAFEAEHPEGGYLVGGYAQRVVLAGTSVTLYLSQITGWSEATSIIKSVEIYSSRPALYANPSTHYGQTVIHGNAVYTILPFVTYEEMNLEGQLMYHQKSVPLADLAAGSVSFTLKFGGNAQIANNLLEVDAGAVTRYGDILSYNARFHFFDSVKTARVEKPYIYSENYEPATTHCLVEYNDGVQTKTAYVWSQGGLIGSSGKVILISSSLNIRNVIFLVEFAGARYNRLTFPITASSTYNYSVFVGDAPDGVLCDRSEYADIIDAGQKDKLSLDEPLAINVTEQYNPFVFRVEHSYLAPGKVLDVQPQMVAVQDVDFGDYPLNVFTDRGVFALLQGSENVFTDRGVFALLQGSENVLYGAFRPISNLVSEANGIPTESGTFIIASGGVWTIAGSRPTLVSDALSLGPHKYVRNNAGYQRISEDDTTGVYDISEFVSDPKFDEYVAGATLSYNRYRDELMVGNPSYLYTYVLSLKYRQWFKVSQTIWQDDPGSTVVNIGTNGGTQMAILSALEDDTTTLVHLQTRPFSVGYQYSHIHRVVAMMRSSLADVTTKIAVALYGSDDLQNWTLISYATREGVQLSQVRTPPAGRSWRYYTVCIGGNIRTDSDLGPVIIDYKPVIRRIG